MKKLVCTSLIAGLVSTTLAAPVSSATGSSTPIVTPRNGIVSPITRPGGVSQSGSDSQNGANQANVTKTGQATSNGTTTVPTNNFAATNNFNGTNNFAGTNGFPGTNGVTAVVNPLTNFPVTVNSNFDGNIVVQDHAVTPSDRILLTTLSQGVRASLGIVPNGNTPVHFLIQNGTVTVVGTVQTTEQSQAVLARVQQTPGVLSVINDMHVSGPFAPAVQNGASSSLLGTPTDRAFSPADQVLLTKVQQEAALQLGVTSTAQMPVHFSIQNGVVGVTGRVGSLQEKQILIAALQRTQGIVRVVDNIAVVPSGNPNVSGFNNGNSLNNGTLTPTGNQSSNFYLPTTNSSGF